LGLTPRVRLTKGQKANEKRMATVAISRKLRMLRGHGLIQKVPRTHRYQVAESGRTILLAVLTVTRISLHKLNQLPGRHEEIVASRKETKI
jgi:DNA-binding HxlR family transcriptional regulator